MLEEYVDKGFVHVIFDNYISIFFLLVSLDFSFVYS